MKRIVLPCCQSWCKMTCNEVQYGWLFLQYLWLTFTRPRFFLQTCFFALNWWMFSFMGLCFIKLSIFNLNINQEMIDLWIIYCSEFNWKSVIFLFKRLLIVHGFPWSPKILLIIPDNFHVYMKQGCGILWWKGFSVRLTFFFCIMYWSIPLRLKFWVSVRSS